MPLSFSVAHMARALGVEDDGHIWEQYETDGPEDERVSAQAVELMALSTCAQDIFLVCAVIFSNFSLNTDDVLELL